MVILGVGLLFGCSDDKNDAQAASADTGDAAAQADTAALEDVAADAATSRAGR